DILFSNSIEINKDLHDNFGLEIPSSVIYNPVLPVSKKINVSELGNKEFNIINVGSLYYIKNQTLLINAFEKLVFESKLYLVDDGKDKNELEILVLQIGSVGKVHFTGKVKNVNDFLLESGCSVLTSNSEGLPNVLIEA